MVVVRPEEMARRPCLEFLFLKEKYVIVLVPDIPDKTSKNNNNSPQFFSSKFIPRIAHEAVVDVQSVEEKVQIGKHGYYQGEHSEK